MSGLDIEAIRGRARIAASVADALPPIGQEAVAATVDAVSALLAEVEQMQGEVEIQWADIAHLQSELDEEKAAGTACRGALADALQVIADLRGGTP